MEVEMISKAGYSQAEAPKVSVAKPEVAEATQTVSVAEHAAPVSMPSGTTGEKGERESGKREHAPSEATINDAVRSANRKMEHTRCEYSYHKETNRVSIKVINDDTDEVIREIPPEKSLDMLQKMWEMAGILVDEKR